MAQDDLDPVSAIVTETVTVPADGGSTDGSETSQAQATAQAAPAEPAWDPRAAYEELKGQLSNYGREAGQARSLQSKIDKLERQLASQSQTKNEPEVLKKLSPEELASTEQLVAALWEKKYGGEFNDLKSFREEMQVERSTSALESATKGLLGAEFEKLEPVMAQIVQAAEQAKQEGNDEASEFLNTLTRMPKVGARILASLARDHYAKGLQGQSAQATNALKAAGAKAAVGVAGGSKGATVQDPSKLSVDELRVLAEKEAIGAL